MQFGGVCFFPYCLGFLCIRRERTQLIFATHVVACYAPGLSTFERARQEMLHYTGFTVDVVHCCELELATAAVEAALQTIAHLAESSKFQDALLKAGVMW